MIRSLRPALVAALALALVLPAGAARADAPGSENTYKQLELFARVLSYVENNYVEPVDQQQLVYGAIKGMLDTLDPHTDVHAARGLQGDEDRHLGRVRRPRDRARGEGRRDHGGRADRRHPGRARGDPRRTIGCSQIDGEATQAMDLARAIQKLRGPAGKRVTLSIMRDGLLAAARDRDHPRPHPDRLGRGRALRRHRPREDQELPGPHRRVPPQGARPAARAQRRPRAARAGARPAQQPGRAARSGGRGERSLPPREPHDRQHQGAQRAQRERREEPRARHRGRLPDGRARQRRERLRLGDRRRRAPGSRPRGGDGEPDLRQGLGADGDRARGRLGAEADDRALLHAEGPRASRSTGSPPTSRSTTAPAR